MVRGSRIINPRSALAFLHDVVVAGLAWLAAFWFRFNFDIPPEYLLIMSTTVGWVVALDAVCFWMFGLYRGLWRYASIHDLREILVKAEKLTEAEQIAREALRIRQEYSGPQHPDVAKYMRGLADVYKAQNKLAEAKEAISSAV